MKTGDIVSYYSVLEYDPELSEAGRHQVKHRIWFGLEDVFGAAAEQFYLDSGHEADWPLTFVLFHGPRGKELARAKVDLEYDPVFYCSDITEAP